MTQIYETFLNNPGWQHLPPLSRVVLGRRKEMSLTHREIAAKIVTSPEESDHVIRGLVAFEKGGPIARRTFEFLIDILDLDVEELDRIIEEQRLDELRRSEGWSLAARPMQLVYHFSRSAGVTQPLPPNIKTPAEAEAFAQETARSKRIHVTLDVQRRVRLTFGITGELESIQRLAAARWSHYPSSPGMHDHPPPDESELDDVAPGALRRSVRRMAEALCRAKGLDPSQSRRTLPNWYHEIDPELLPLFNNADFWNEVGRPEKPHGGVNDVFEWD